jgi:hypothetical protein
MGGIKMPKYKDIKVKLVGEDGNAFFILSRCLQAMKRAGLSEEERQKFQKEATAGNYDHLLATCIEWFDIE